MLTFLLFSENLNLFTHLLMCFIFGSLLTLLPVVLIKKKYTNEKVSPYECGFQPFENARTLFNVQFYLVAILFLIFDVEILFLIPGVLTFVYTGLMGFVIFLIFFLLLATGIFYELYKNALEWN